MNPDPVVRAWVEEINQAGGGRVEWIFRTGGRFIKAKSELDRGQWGQLFGQDGVNVGQRTAEMFMTIARHPILADTKYFSKLPGRWSVLHALCKVPEEVLTAAIASGLVKPDMTLRQARGLAKGDRAGATGPADPPAGEKFNIDKRRTHLGCFLEREARRWPMDHWAELAEDLRDFAAGLLKGQA